MDAIQELFSEYIRMRENGLDIDSTLHSLRPFIEPLELQAKEELASYLRKWERGEIDGPQQPGAPPPQSRIQPIQPKRQEEELPPLDSTWLTCGNCSTKNRRSEVFCYSCGHILEQAPGQFDTRHFTDAMARQYEDDFFSADSVLVLEMRHSKQFFELRPQQQRHEIVIGRSTGKSAMMPDVDVATHQGADLGVSRLHMAVQYDSEANALQVYDLGSANGSFVNGQKLNPKELRVLRNGDELRLGRLVMHVRYLHPGDEVS